MNGFKDLKIKSKLLITFTIVIFLALAVGAMGLIGMLHLKADMTNEAKIMLPGIQSLLAIKECQTAIVAGERMLAAPGISTDEQKNQYAVIDDQRQQIDADSATYEQLKVSAEDRKSWEEYKKLKTIFYSNIDKIVALSKEASTSGDAKTAAAKYAELTALTNGDGADSYTAVDDALDGMTTVTSKESDDNLTSSDNIGTLLIGILVGLTCLALAIGVFMSLSVSNQISKPIKKLADGANKLAAGDININLDITSKDEVGMLAHSFEKVIDAIKALIFDIQFLMESSQEGKLAERADASKHNGEYKTIIVGFNNTLEAIVTPMNEATSVLKKVAVNDYTKKVEGNYKGDMKVMTDSINDILTRLLSVEKVFENLAVGDISLLAAFEKIGRRSENDKLMPAGIKMMQAIQDMTDDANMLSKEATKGNLNVRGDASKYEGKYSQLIIGINRTIDAVVTPMSEALSVLQMMAQNDLTRAMNGQYQGEFENFAQSLNTVIETLSETLSDINNAAEQVASGTHQVSDGAQALSQGATEQASSIEELTASLSEIAGQTRQNAINAGQASDLAQAARDSAADGKVQMSELQQAMTAINESSANISKIIKVIDEIAFQTNLLALNAAVEAARAGQHGKGFAVVAEEVRNLAQRSANAAKETTEMIEGSIKKVQAGTQIANDTATALVKIVGSVEKATELVGGIAKASNDQAMAVAQVNTGIEQVSQVTQTNSATAEESAAASEELSSQAALLKEMVSRFSLRGQAHIGGQKASFQPQSPARALGPGKPSGKPKITLNDREFGKY